MIPLIVIIVSMLVITVLFFSNLGLKKAGIFWAICLGVVPLIFIGVPGWLVLTVQFFNCLIYYVVGRYGKGP